MGLTLEGKRILVTGASSGVGRAISLRLAAAGASVGVTGRDEGRLRETVDRAPAGSGAIVAFSADLDSDEEVRALAAWSERTLGAPEILVHCAGTIALGPVEEASVEALDRQYGTNLRAPYLLTRLLLDGLKKRAGQIVFVNSTAGLVAGAESSAYAASKHGLRALADSLRQEVNEDGVRVLSVFLGRTATPMQEAVHAHESRPYRPERLIQAGDVGELVASILALPRTVEVTDVRLRPAMKPLPSRTEGK